MRKTSLYVAVWFVAGVGAVALATGAVSMVGSQVTGDRPAPLSADQVRSELAAAAASSTTTVSGTPTTGPGSAITETGGAPTTTTPDSSGGPGGPAPTVAPSDPGPSPTTTAPPPAATPTETRTYTLVGGTATLQFGPSGVTVLAASPNPGYDVELEPTHDTGVRVEFESDGHRSRVEGWWDGGPRDEVEETD